MEICVNQDFHTEIARLTLLPGRGIRAIGVSCYSSISKSWKYPDFRMITCIFSEALDGVSALAVVFQTGTTRSYWMSIPGLWLYDFDTVVTASCASEGFHGNFGHVLNHGRLSTVALSQTLF